MRVYIYTLSGYLLFLLVYLSGEFLGCVYMIPGSPEWCEPILLWFDR